MYTASSEKAKEIALKLKQIMSVYLFITTVVLIETYKHALFEQHNFFYKNLGNF